MRNDRYILLTAALSFVCAVASATVARPDPFTYTQPDGSTVTIQLHGDESYHWATDQSGRDVELSPDGYYRPVVRVSKALRARQAEQARARRVATAGPSQRLHRIGSSPKGNDHHLVLLVEFADLGFTIDDPRASIGDLLNKKGYSANGATGSANDYFYENSCGAFDPIFDIVGPVTLDRNYAYYGQSDECTAEALYEACLKLDGEIDFSIYDRNNDGSVDDIFFYFAGYNEAEGGGADCIWPHAWSLWKFNCVCDGVRIYRYACTSEFKGSSGGNMCSIGTFCHEFSHILGLPDFYDTDYDMNGSAASLYNYSLMCNGNYNNGGCTPPYLNAVERNLLGWMGEPDIWTAPGVKTIPGIQNNVAYMLPSEVDGEVFIFETRTGEGWDSRVPPGLLVYHLDRSDRPLFGSTARGIWNSGYNINTHSDHPLFYIVPASSVGLAGIPFPGYSNITSLSPETVPALVDWDGAPVRYSLSDIEYKDGCSTLSLAFLRPVTEGGFYAVTYIAYDEDSIGVGADLKLSLGNAPATVQGVTWYLDGVPIDGDTVVLEEGGHDISAVLEHKDGAREILFTQITVR